MSWKLVGLWAVLSWTPSAFGYGFMMRHEYTTCAQCHYDPSGGSLVTPYGRAQGETLLRSRYGTPPDDSSKVGDFLFGLFKLPEEVQLSGDVRGALLGNSNVTRVFPMQADLTFALTSGKLIAAGSLGAGSASTAPATLVGSDARLISRHHWVGFAPDEDKLWLIRAGRMNLPFGLRLPEHITWVRQTTRTDTNLAQQHGVSVSYSGEKLRAEVMGIVGNLLLQPQDYRERGYSGFAEWVVTPTFTLGAQSLLTHAFRDLLEPNRAVFRQAHGAMLRWLPTPSLLVSAEADFVWTTLRGRGGTPGWVGLLQLDFEPTQGLHLVGAAEAKATFGQDALNVGGWLGAWWFLAPHTDVRADVIQRQENGVLSTTLLAQLHFYL